MGTLYQVPPGEDVACFVRVFFVDGTNTPVPGLVVPYILRDQTGASVLTGNLVDVAGAPGWYTLDAFQLSATPQIYTAQYDPPVGYNPDADLILTLPDADDAACQGQAYFVQPGN